MPDTTHKGKAYQDRCPTQIVKELRGSINSDCNRYSVVSRNHARLTRRTRLKPRPSRPWPGVSTRASVVPKRKPLKTVEIRLISSHFVSDGTQVKLNAARHRRNSLRFGLRC